MGLYWRIWYDFFESFWIHLDIIKSIPFRTCFSSAASGMAGTPWTTTLWGTPCRPTMHIALRWDWPHRGVRCNGQMQQVPSSQGVFKRFQSHVQHICTCRENISWSWHSQNLTHKWLGEIIMSNVGNKDDVSRKSPKFLERSSRYSMVNKHNYGKSQFSMGKSTINGHFQ